MVIDAGRAFFVSSAGSNVGDHPDLGGTRSSPACSSKCLQWSTKSTQSLHNDLVLTMSTPSVLVTPAPNWGNRPLFREVTLPRAIILRRTDYISTRPSIMTMPTKVILASPTSAPPPIPADNPGRDFSSWLFQSHSACRGFCKRRKTGISAEKICC